MLKIDTPEHHYCYHPLYYFDLQSDIYNLLKTHQLVFCIFLTSLSFPLKWANNLMNKKSITYVL